MFKRTNKIFCISFQRTGTTSVGGFFRDHGFKVAGYEYARSMKWSEQRFTGNIEAIFKSEEFKNHRVFEDNPWWELDFYKILYHRFPNSKFILFTRDPDKWFDSMISHSEGKTLGNTFRHSKLYRREIEYFNLYPNRDNYKNIKVIDNLLDLNELHRTHYQEIYTVRNREIIEFFSFFDRSRLIHLELEDTYKWQKLGEFFGIKVKENYTLHLNKSK